MGLTASNGGSGKAPRSTTTIASTSYDPSSSKKNPGARRGNTVTKRQRAQDELSSLAEFRRTRKGPEAAATKLTPSKEKTGNKGKKPLAGKKNDEKVYDSD